jgi:hypothetical protein
MFNVLTPIRESSNAIKSPKWPFLSLTGCAQILFSHLESRYEQIGFLNILYQCQENELTCLESCSAYWKFSSKFEAGFSTKYEMKTKQFQRNF